MTCAVKGCSNIKEMKPEGISFHGFPQGELLKNWLTSLEINAETWNWTKNKYVCSNHFKSADYATVKGNKKVLKSDAIPCIEDLSEDTDSADSIISFAQLESDSIEKQETVNIKLRFDSFTPNSGVDSISNISIENLSEESENSEMLFPPIEELQTVNIKLSLPAKSRSHQSSGRKKFVKSIHSYSLSPSKMKIQLEELRKTQKQNQRRLYYAKRRIGKLQQQLTSMTTLLKRLQQQNVVLKPKKSYKPVPQIRKRGNLNIQTLIYKLKKGESIPQIRKRKNLKKGTTAPNTSLGDHDYT